MNDDQRLLANAYLDEEVTADERARAEADPEVVDEVARIRAVREAMRVIERPDATRRDAAIHAALDAFEVRPAAATIATTPELPVAPPVSLAASRRGRWLRPLSAAAAVVLVIAGGFLVLRDGGQDSDDDAATEAPQELSAAATALTAEEGADAATDTAAAAGGELAAPEATIAASSVLTSPDDLAAFAAAATAPDARAESDEASRCALGEWVGTAVYQRDGEQLMVDVFVEGSEAIAADPVSCEVVARAQLP